MPDDESLLARNPTFRRFWLAHLVERFAAGLRGVALPWLILALTGSPFQLGVAFALRSAPDIVVAPVIGAAIDRLRRKRLLILARIVTGLTLGALPALWLAGALSVWHVYVGMVVLSVFGNLSHNTRQTLVPTLVAEDDLDAANSWLFGSGAALATAFLLVGGVLTAAVGPGPSLLAAGAAFVAAGVALVAVDVPRRDRSEKQDLPGVTSSLSSFRDGLDVIRSTPLVLEVLVLGVAFNVLVVPYRSVLFPTVGEAVFGSAAAFTALVVAFQAGKVLGNAMTARLSLSRRQKMVGGVCLVGIGALATGVAGTLLAPGGGLVALGSLAATVFVVGLGNPLFNAPGSSVVQSAVDEDTRGTVITVQNSLLQASFPLPLLGAGYLLELVSAFDLFAATGVGALVLGVALGIRWRGSPSGSPTAG